ncbi:MAG: GreA/GreB family elongation factor [Puniceicoccales bacterium]|jgi:transcription elongation GreA/GreB family factor|nr:GreA/GreB family elongation factor [Puniceicoccales bacterium]
MDKTVIEQIVRRQPLLDRELVKLENIKEGSYCIHNSWGLGHIEAYDPVLNKLKIIFEDREERLMDPVFCAKKLDILAENHILVQYKIDPKAIEERVKNTPVELLFSLIENHPHQELALSEIEFIFKRILGEKEFRRWWTVVKKLLAKDPFIVLSPKRSNTYVFREQPISVEDEVIEQIQMHKDPAKKIEIAARILKFSRESQIAMATEIRGVLDDLNHIMAGNDKRLSTAQKLMCCWIRNDLTEVIGEDMEYFEPTAESLIRDCNNLGKLVEELPASYFERFLLLVTCAFPDEWEMRCAHLLRNSQGRFTNECILFLTERGCHDFLKECFRRWLNECSLKSPLLHWIIKNRHVRKFADIISKELINFKLLKAIFLAIDSEALASTSSKRIPLAELVSEDRNLIRDLLSDASEENARDLCQMLMQNQWFDALTKRLLLARFIKEFPSVQSLISEKVSDKRLEDNSLIVSRTSFDAKKKEYEILINEKIPANKKAIETAREHGDLSENSEYKMARQDQELLLSRRDQLEIDLKKAHIIDFSAVDKNTVGIGSIVRLRSDGGEAGETVEYAILGAWDSDPDRHILSYKTPLAQALLSRRVGDDVELTMGDKVSTWKIENIARYVDSN